MRTRNIDDIYQEVTGVNINEQKDIWDERGKGYYGEYLLFKELYSWIEGNCKILMNLQVPTEFGSNTEIDLIMFHETGIYVFEVKHFKGTIYGKITDEKWTQYFRTTKNKYFFNPVGQNQYHIEALKRIYKDVPIYSFVVFTNSECELHIEDTSEKVKICTLSDMKNILKSETSKKGKYDLKDIDKMFEMVLRYAPDMKKVCISNSKEEPLYCYLNEFIRENQTQRLSLSNQYSHRTKVLENEFEKKEIELESRYLTKERFLKNRLKKIVAVVIIVSLIIVALAIKSTANNNEKRIEAENRLAEFAQKFEHVDAFNNGEIQFKEDVISIYDLMLDNSTTLEKTVDFSCTIKHNNSNYGIIVDQDSKITVILKNGNVKEYDIFNEIYPFYGKHYIGSKNNKEAKILLHELHNVSKEEISYVKLTNLDLWCNINDNKWVTVIEDYEIEVYAE